MLNKFSEYFSSFDFLKDLFLIILGAVLSFLWQKIKEINADRRRINRIKKNRRAFEKLGIVSLANPYPAYVMDNVKLLQSHEVFLIDMENSEKDIIFDNKTLEQLGNDMGIEGLADMVDTCRVETKALFEENSTGRKLFNNSKFGIRHISVSNTEDGEEEDTLEIKFYKTNYFTHKVMRSVYWKLKAQGHPIADFHRLEDINLNKYYPFLTSFGVNSFLVLDSSEEDPCLVISKRSKYMSNMEKDLWHVTMNEGLSITDIESGSANRISFEKCIERGYREECGIKEDNHKLKYKFSDLFMVRDNFEIGIFATARVDMSQEDYGICYEGAKDSHMETANYRFISIRPESIRMFLNKNEMTEAGKYCLTQFLSRRI